MGRTPRAGASAWRHAAAAGACASLLLAASIAAAQGCPCAKRDLAATVKHSDVIFVGKPLAATTDSARDRNQPAVEYQARFAFEVATVLKGSTSRATTVVTPAGACAATFAVGTDYLVLGTKQGGAIVTDACQGNVAGVAAIRARTAEIRGALGQKPPPSPAAAR